jgi:hypothetical protein
MAGMTRRVLSVGLCAVALVLGSAASGQAVVGGQPDGGAHPNVGIIVGFDASGASTYFCTGTLVDPYTVLTAAHCVSPALSPDTARIVVTFQSRLGHLPDGRFDTSPSITGSPEPNPAWFPTITPAELHGGTNAFFANSALDIGLLHLTENAVTKFGISPAPITAAGTNEVYKTGQDKALLTQVGYGVNRDGPSGRPDSYFVEGIRNQSMVTPKKIDAGVLYVGANPNDQAGYGSPCSGDSGSPVLRGTTITSLFAFAQGNCQNTGGGPRLDAGPGRAFLRDHGLVP